MSYYNDEEEYWDDQYERQLEEEANRRLADEVDAAIQRQQEEWAYWDRIREEEKEYGE